MDELQQAYEDFAEQLRRTQESAETLRALVEKYGDTRNEDGQEKTGDSEPEASEL